MTIRELSWWTFYLLFLMIVLFLLSLLVRALIGGALAGISNPARFVYSVGLMMAVFGLMAMCIAYIVRVLWHRLKDNRRGHIQRN